MSIETIAESLISAKQRFDVAETSYYVERDKMHNALGAQPNASYSFGGYTFTRVGPTSVISVNKESVISALHNAGLSQETIDKVLGEALIEREQGSSIRITSTQA